MHSPRQDQYIFAGRIHLLVQKLQGVAELAAMAAGAYHSSSANSTIMDLFYALLLTIVILGTALALFLPAANYDPKPRLFIRLVEVQGLDPCIPETEVRSPTFELAVDVGRVSESRRGPCAGGGDAMLRVSYRGKILAWGGVPRFCVDGRCLQGPSASVATVVATAEGLVLQQELRNKICAETYALGRAEFDVEGSVPGLGHLRCKTYLFQGDQTDALPPCSFHKDPEEGTC
ncbi:uncharacterized protein [Aegilops tauschii subsp. strangulata]|nr:uncharacterized protein LOC120965206 [Aegilops tauschii subsp. strangulata]XP_045084956.1 uncharacterized protein LOC120965206 [Aegilops tauschii subsp. strangulata]